jgi:hypothetical protein
MSWSRRASHRKPPCIIYYILLHIILPWLQAAAEPAAEHHMPERSPSMANTGAGEAGAALLFDAATGCH